MSERKLRVLIAAEYARPWPGGISEHVFYEARHLARAGHSVTVLSGPGTTADQGVAAIALGRAVAFESNGAASRLSIGRALLGLNARLQGYDVVHVHAPFDPILPLAVVLAAPCPVVGTFHASHGRGALWSLLYGSALAAAAAKKLTCAIAVSAEARRSITQYQPGLSLNSIPNGVDCARFDGPRPQERATPVITFVGRPDPRKGLGYLLRAFDTIVRRGVAAELRVVGVDQLPPHEAALLSVAARQRLTLLGYLTPDALTREIRGADVLCAPSTHGESQGIVLLEGMAAGAAVVASDIAGYRDVINHQSTGLLCPPADAEVLASTLTELVNDPALRARLGEQGKVAAAAYDWSNIGARIETCLLSAANAPLQSRGTRETRGS